MQTIKITIEVDVPDNATEEDISAWVDVQYGEWNSMKSDNPCINDYEIQDVTWEDL